MGAYFLNQGKLKGPIGRFLALTGTRLRASDALEMGLITHYIPRKDTPKLFEELKRIKDPNLIGELIGTYTQKPLEVGEVELHKNEIEKCFTTDSIEEIFQKLKDEKSSGKWAHSVLLNLRSKSPTSLKVVFKEMKLGENMSIKEICKLDYRIALHFMLSHDFHEGMLMSFSLFKIEGVRAVLIDKDDNPKWKPEMVEEVSATLVDSFFTLLKPYKDIL